MILPSVCVMIPTYARTKLLAEAIKSVLQQDYKGDFCAIVLNDCQRQTIVCRDSRIAAFNHYRQFASLGEKRDHMLGSSLQFDWIAFLDDDDLWMPWYLSSALNSVTDDIQAVFPTHQFKTEGRGKGIRYPARG